MLVFIHGMWSNANVWQDFMDYFKKRNFECKAINLKKNIDLKKANFMDYVNRVINAIDKDDILIGHSMGGLIVQKIAEKDIVGGVAICSAPPKGIEMNIKIKIASLKFLPKIIMKKPFKPDYKFVKKYILNCVDEKEARKIYEEMEIDSSIVAYEIAMNKIEVDEKKVKCPLLLIAVKEDKISPPQMVKKIARKYDADYKLYNGCHWIFKDWREIADGISEFLIKLYG